MLNKKSFIFAMIVSTIISTSPFALAIETIKADGSSTVFPITEAVAEEFQNLEKNQIRVTVGISGTGGGFKKFCRGETDVQNASRPIQQSEIEECRKVGVKYMELPVGYDATVVVVNPKNKWANEITTADLKKIWEPSAQGKILKWNQIQAQWPDENLKLYGAGADSGTFDYFTEAIVGKSKSSRGDYTASEDDNTLVLGVSKDNFSLGYLPLAYYEENKSKLKALAIVSSDGKKGSKGVLPSKETVENGTYFPLSRPIFIYVNAQALTKPHVKKFVEFYLDQAPRLVPQVKYVGLPTKAYEMGKDNLKKNKLGTVFGGHSEVGLSIEKLLKKESTL